MAKTNFNVNRNELEITMDRVFDAPANKVFEAYTNPELIPQWWGPANLTTTVEKMDVKPGGKWRYIQRDQSGKEYAFNGVYQEIDPPKKISTTFEFEDQPGHISVDEAILEEMDGKTKLTTISKIATPEELDNMVNSGMEKGATESLERLAKLIEKN